MSKDNVFDRSTFPGNYHDYPDDDIALQRELELGEALTSTYLDEVFPPNARSLYFDPLNPPKGTIPNESIKWYSISEGTLAHCDDYTKPYWGDVSSPYIRQGALGDCYFINALSLMATQSKFIERTLVSFKYASKGLYTFKFYKSGKWRYIHIDDYIPCRQSGKVHFSRNRNPNETFAMLYEKAYAKLHGCYEAISYGLIEKVLQELTPAAGVQTIRIERLSSQTICDEVWEKLEKATTTQALIGCGRFVEDPLKDNPAFQQGITLGKLYQIVDVCVASAEPTEDFDALTVGMICVRNLQPNKGRFTGRWSFGHRLWIDYKEIATELRNRTREVQHKRGLGPHPSEHDDPKMDSRNIPLSYKEMDDYPDDEPDTLDVQYIEKQSSFKIVQPMADDLHWIQIEDFVDIFNRVYIVNDLMFEKKGTCRRYVSKWLPGDYIVGSGGPPVIVTKELVEEDANENNDDDDGENGGSKVTEDDDEDGTKSHKTQKFTRTATINESFTDNPMFPFAVTEPARVAITLYQLDKRWNVGRVGDDPRQVVSLPFLSRKERLEAVMHYPVGIGFLVVRLSGLKHRLTEFRLKKMAGTCEAVMFSHSTSNFLALYPGRYAIIPYTHAALDRAMDYAVHIHCLSNQVEFEIDDPIAQRLEDKDPSEEGEGYDEEPDDNDLLRAHKDDDDVSIMSYEVEEEKGEDDEEEDDNDEEESQIAIPKMIPLPRVLLYKHWEYVEDIEELSILHLYGEVGDMMAYLRTLKEEIRKLNGAIKTLTTMEALSVPKKEEESKKLSSAPSQSKKR